MLRRLGIIAFSVFYWPAAFATMLVGAIPSLTLLVLRFPYQRVHLWVTAPVFSFCVPLSLTRMRVHYHPDFDPKRPSVYVQNHINLIDGMVAAGVIPHAFSGLMNAWQFKIPIYGWLMALSKGIAVRRGEGDTVGQISRAAAERKRIGMSVLTFPEGHRTRDGKIHEFRRGVFLMARNADMPVVPVTVKGMYDVNRKGSMLFFPFRTIDVFVGPQHETTGLTDEDVPKFAEQLRQHMLHCFEHGEWPEAVQSRRAATDQRSCIA